MSNDSEQTTIGVAPPRAPDELFTALQVIIIIVMTIGIPGNALTIASVCKYKRLRSAGNLFITNLSISDGLYYTMVLPLRFALFEARQELYSEQFCVFLGSIAHLLNGVSMLCLSAIALNRLLYISQYKYYHKLYSWTCLVGQIVGIWLTALILTVIFPCTGVWGDFSFQETVLSCTFTPESDPAYRIVIVTIGFWIPTIFIVGCYSIIYFHFITNQNKINTWEENRFGASFQKAKHVCRNNVSVKVKLQNIEEDRETSSSSLSLQTNKSECQDDYDYVKEFSSQVQMHYLQVPKPQNVLQQKMKSLEKADGNKKDKSNKITPLEVLYKCDAEILKTTKVKNNHNDTILEVKGIKETGEIKSKTNNKGECSQKYDGVAMDTLKKVNDKDKYGVNNIEDDVFTDTAGKKSFDITLKQKLRVELCYGQPVESGPSDKRRILSKSSIDINVTSPQLPSNQALPLSRDLHSSCGSSSTDPNVPDCIIIMDNVESGISEENSSSTNNLNALNNVNRDAVLNANKAKVTKPATIKNTRHIDVGKSIQTVSETVPSSSNMSSFQKLQMRTDTYSNNHPKMRFLSHRKKYLSRRRKESVKITLMMVCIYCLFVVCILPYFLVNIIYSDLEVPTAYLVALMFTWFNGCVNPIIYALMNAQFRYAYKEIITRFFPCDCDHSGDRNRLKNRKNAGKKQKRISWKLDQTATHM